MRRLVWHARARRPSLSVGVLSVARGAALPRGGVAADLLVLSTRRRHFRRHQATAASLERQASWPTWAMTRMFSARLLEPLDQAWRPPDTTFASCQLLPVRAGSSRYATAMWIQRARSGPTWMVCGHRAMPGATEHTYREPLVRFLRTAAEDSPGQSRYMVSSDCRCRAADSRSSTPTVGHRLRETKNGRRTEGELATSLKGAYVGVRASMKWPGTCSARCLRRATERTSRQLWPSIIHGFVPNKVEAFVHMAELGRGSEPLICSRRRSCTTCGSSVRERCRRADRHDPDNAR